MNGADYSLKYLNRVKDQYAVRRFESEAVFFSLSDENRCVVAASRARGQRFRAGSFVDTYIPGFTFVPEPAGFSSTRYQTFDYGTDRAVISSMFTRGTGLWLMLLPSGYIPPAGTAGSAEHDCESGGSRDTFAQKYTPDAQEYRAVTHLGKLTKIVSGLARGALTSSCVSICENIAGIAMFCGCGIDLTGLPRSLCSFNSADPVKTGAIFALLALMFRRIAAGRGFNLKTDSVGGIPLFTLSARLYNGSRHSDEPVDLSEYGLAARIAEAGGVSIRSRTVSVDNSEMLVLRFNPVPEGAAGGLRAGEWERRIVRPSDELPFDPTGKY